MSESGLLAFLPIFARAAAFAASAPVIGDRHIPVRARLVFAAGVAMVLFPTREPGDPAELFMAIPAELVLGVIAGFSGRLVLAGAETGGQLIGLPFSLGFAATIDPGSGETALVTRRIALTLAALAFVTAGGLQAGVQVMLVAKPTVTTLGGAMLHIVRSSGEMFVSGLRLAAPALVAGLIANLGVALASRAAPSLNIFSVMLAAMLVVGGFTMVATSPAFVYELGIIADRAVSAIGTLGAL